MENPAQGVECSHFLSQYKKKLKGRDPCQNTTLDESDIHNHFAAGADCHFIAANSSR